MNSRLKRIGATLALIVIVMSVGFVAWTRVARYPASPEARSLARSAKSERGWYVFEPVPVSRPEASRVGFIFYPGGLVEPAAYAPLMRRLSQGGVRTVIVPMPLDLAVFGSQRADDVIAAYPGVDTWVIGGHSLGGAMASEFVERHPDAVEGLVLLASYPAESTDLSTFAVSVLSVYGTEDGVAGDVFEESLERLPAGTRLEVVEGGNHAQFGDYGPQKGDGVAAVSRAEQQRLTTEGILRLVEGLE